MPKYIYDYFTKIKSKKYRYQKPYCLLQFGGKKLIALQIKDFLNDFVIKAS